MRVRPASAALAGLAAVIGLTGGCAELYLLFGPGGPAGLGGPTQGAVAGTSQPAAIPGPSFAAMQLDPVLESTAGARVIIASDMDGDGLTDFVSGSAENQPIQLHMRNAGALSYTTLTIAGGAPIATMFDVAASDLDADGNPDVAVLVNDSGFIPVAGASLRGAVVLLFAPPEPRDNLLWQQVTITDTFLLPGDDAGLTDFAVVEIDGVNGPDILVGSNEETNPASNKIYLYRNPGGAAARNGSLWARTTVHADAPPFRELEPSDIDGDGDLDVVASFPISRSFNVRWLQNPLTESGLAAVTLGNWQIRNIGEQRQLTQPGDTQDPGADLLAVGDIDADGDPDVASVDQSLGLIQWFDNPGPPTVQVQTFPWQVFNLGEVSTSAPINVVQLVDLNLDGLLDVYVTATGNMLGFQRGAEVHAFWTPFLITGTNPVARIGKSAFSDADGNGLLDIIAPLDREGVTRDSFLILLRLTP